MFSYKCGCAHGFMISSVIVALNTCFWTLLTLLLKASHDLDIGEILQLVAHRDGVIRGAELTVYGGL